MTQKEIDIQIALGVLSFTDLMVIKGIDIDTNVNYFLFPVPNGYGLRSMWPYTYKQPQYFSISAEEVAKVIVEITKELHINNLNRLTDEIIYRYYQEYLSWPGIKSWL